MHPNNLDSAQNDFDSASQNEHAANRRLIKALMEKTGIQGKGWEFSTLSDSELVKLQDAVRVCIRDYHDPKQAWWLLFESAFEGLGVTAHFDGTMLPSGYSLFRPDNKPVEANELLYLFSYYMASPPSVEFFESMMDGWIYHRCNT